ncbi:uncharacterized protein LOC127536046 isoform X2 [Acanthochromis polyacanthus]|uniref:uncharacterized protein LOC127536046 isoform X2 n=1 Tax=Acanthochromis polyacanthus TaxID=80966 RepID=UPI002233F038|nr:uncharacterized protein LOC127536046 isoform X2 [Acanthochromis polyacanthus]
MVSTIIHKPHGSPAGQCSQSPVGSASSICTWTLDTLLSPGPWRQLGVNDVQENMLQIRRWWCLVLLQNFPMLSKEERLQQRKRQREQKKLQDVAEVPLKMFRLSESATEASDEAENRTGNRKRGESFGQGCNGGSPVVWDQNFQGKNFPSPSCYHGQGATREGRELLCVCDGQEEEETADLREPFLFLFSLQEDYETFCQEIIDRRNMKVFCAFDRKE